MVFMVLHHNGSRTLLKGKPAIMSRFALGIFAFPARIALCNLPAGGNDVDPCCRGGHGRSLPIADTRHGSAAVGVNRCMVSRVLRHNDSRTLLKGNPAVMFRFALGILAFLASMWGGA